MSTQTAIMAAVNAMAKQRFQDPTIQRNTRGGFFIRPWVDVLEKGTLTRKKVTIPLGDASLGARKAQAEKTRIMQTINNGQFMAMAQVTMNTMLEEYQGHVDKLGYATRLKYASHIEKHIRPTFGSMQLCEITPKRVQDWLDSLELSWSTKTDIRNILSGIFTQAIRWEYWKERNPIEYVSAGRKEMVWEKRKLSIQETRDLLEELKPMPRIVCMVALFTTLRISEILGLQEKHLNFVAGQIEVRQRHYRGDTDRTKTVKSTRNVTMGGLTDYLKSLCVGDPEAFIFLKHESCRTDENLRKRHLTPAAKAIGVHHLGFGFHSLRREAITEIGANVAPQTILNMAGHTKMDLTMLYTLNDTEKQRVAATEYMNRVVN